MNEDTKELMDILKKGEQNQNTGGSGKVRAINEWDFVPEALVENMPQGGGHVQWSSNDGKMFVPAHKTAKKLTPGVYDIASSPNIGIFFQKVPIVTTGLLRFPETNSERVVAEIQNFWTKEDVFREYKLAYKRGIILWGPPGSGKSCTIQLIMQDVVKRGGVVIKFGHPTLFSEGIRRFREIQPSTPIVVLMEDIDSTLEMYSETDVLNILDGIDQVDKAVFLATTNYPEKLGARIINRPSRFDKRFKIGFPNAESRKIYFEFIIGEQNIKEKGIDINQWVEDTNGFSLAHMKELFTAVVILGDEYEEALETLATMIEIAPDSVEDEPNSSKKMGFGQEPKARFKRANGQAQKSSGHPPMGGSYGR